MTPLPTSSGSEVHFELRFVGMFDTGRGYAFPCDANGKVNLDELSESGRTNYFFARMLIGRDLSMPVTCAMRRS